MPNGTDLMTLSDIAKSFGHGYAWAKLRAVRWDIPCVGRRYSRAAFARHVEREGHDEARPVTEHAEVTPLPSWPRIDLDAIRRCPTLRLWWSDATREPLPCAPRIYAGHDVRLGQGA